MATVQVLRQPPPCPPERDALAEAIVGAAAAKRAAEAAHDAAQRAGDMVARAAAQVEAATAEATRARDEQTARIVEAAKTGAPLAPDQTIRAARLALADAEDELEAARQAVTTCEAAAVEADDSARQADEHIDDAVKAVLAPAATRLLDELQKMQVEVCEKRIELWSLSKLLAEPDRRAVSDVLGKPFLQAELDHKDTPRCHAWREAQRALHEDANASLPA